MSFRIKVGIISSLFSDPLSSKCSHGWNKKLQHDVTCPLSSAFRDFGWKNYYLCHDDPQRSSKVQHDVPLMSGKVSLPIVEESYDLMVNRDSYDSRMTLVIHSTIQAQKWFNSRFTMSLQWILSSRMNLWMVQY